MSSLTGHLGRSPSHSEVDNVISFSLGLNKDALTISFERTVKVPENHHYSQLPPSLGKFPLYPIGQYADRLPKPIADKKSLFVPLHGE